MKNEITCELSSAMSVVNAILEHYTVERHTATRNELKVDMFLRQFGIESKAQNIVTELEAKLILRLIGNCYGPNWTRTHEV
jgi:hypothetical protein